MSDGGATRLRRPSELTRPTAPWLACSWKAIRSAPSTMRPEWALPPYQPTSDRQGPTSSNCDWLTRAKRCGSHAGRFGRQALCPVVRLGLPGSMERRFSRTPTSGKRRRSPRQKLGLPVDMPLSNFAPGGWKVRRRATLNGLVGLRLGGKPRQPAIHRVCLFWGGQFVNRRSGVQIPHPA